MKKTLFYLFSVTLGVILVIAGVYFFYSKQLYDDKAVKTEMDLFSIQGGVLFYNEKYSALPPNLGIMFKTVGLEACESDSIFPDQYTGNQSESKKYTGTGGWVYNPDKKIIRLNYMPWHPPYRKFILRVETPKDENNAK